MKVFTKLLSVMMVLVLSSSLVFGQSSNLDKLKVSKTTDLTTDTYDGVKPIANPNSVVSNVSYASSNPAKSVLWDNGPLVTHPAGGFGGYDASALQSVTGPLLSTYGFGAQQSAGNSMADDFTVTDSWTLNTMTFYSYQTGSTTTSTITGIYVQIWNGAPNAGGAIVWGDLTTNRLASTQWSSIYRCIESNLLASDRPIMEVVADVSGCVLSAGTYWVQYQFTGTLASGPWAPPISIWDQGITGNALQYTSTGWAAAVSGTAPNTYAQGVPFIIDGTAGATAAIFEDNFDAYTAGGQVACQNPTEWTTWSNAPCGSEDAYVSSLYAHSSPNSAVIAQNNDLVKDFGDAYTSGKYKISFWVYIPTGKAGYFNTLSSFAGSTSSWGLEVYFNLGGAGSLNAGGTGAATFTWTENTWFFMENVVDLDSDWAEFWIDGNMIYEWQWTLGSNGVAIPNTLDANDFFGATANDQMYIDDYKLEELPGVVLNPPTSLTATVSDNDVHLDWNAPAGKALLGYNVYRDDVMINYTTATEYDDMDLAEGTYGYYVTAVYDEGESVASNTVSATISSGPSGVIFTYDFENYTSGGQVACQTPDEWTTWSNAPCGTEDAYISTEQAYSGVNSVMITGTTTDLVKEFPNYTSGHYTISFQMYVVSGYVAYFNTLQDFAGSTSQWGMQVYFGADNVNLTPGQGWIDGGGALAASFNFDYDTWMLIEVDVDLDQDWAEFYVDGNLVNGWMWSSGAFGTGTLNQLSANDFFAYTGATVGTWPCKYFFDDYMLEGVMPLSPPTNLTYTVSNGDIILNWTAPAGKSYNKNIPTQELPAQVTSELSKYTNSVHNNLLNEYKQSGQEIKAEQMVSDAKTPAKYKSIKLDIKGTTAYACVAYDPSSVNPIGPATFDTDYPGTITSLAPGSSGDFIAGGSWAEGVWYGEEYGTSALYTIDPSSGAMNLVGYGSGSGGFNALAYDVTTTTMFGCDYNGSSCGLYSINLTNGASTYIGDVGLGALVIGLACDASGNLYAADLFADNLLSINKSTGAGTIIGPMGIDINYAQDLEYDNENDVLYLAGYTTTGQLYTVNPATGTATYVGDFQGGAEMCGLAFEYTAVQYTNDIGIQSILSPTSGVNLGNETVSVRIKNFGTASQSNFTISYTLDGGAPVNATITNTIAGGATFDYTFPGTVDLSAYGTYTFVACTYLAGDENSANDCKTKPVSNNYPAYCDASTGTQDEYIGNVLCGSINNTTGWQGGVGNYTGMSTTIDAGMSEDITVTNGGNLYTSDMVTCWVDWNMNYVFDQGGNEEFILTNVGGTGQTFTGAIAVPAGTPGGGYTMRVRMTWSTAPVPCGAASYGEVEDYTINVGGTVTGLLGYNVYHSYQNGTFSVLDFVTPTTYTHFDPAVGLHKYYVTAVYDEGESGPTNTVQVTITGIQESIAESTQIYPNPAKDVLNIKSEYDIKSVRVYNHSGQIIASELVDTKFYQFNTSKLTPGLYMFQIDTNEGTITKRIIIE